MRKHGRAPVAPSAMAAATPSRDEVAQGPHAAPAARVLGDALQVLQVKTAQPDQQGAEGKVYYASWRIGAPRGFLPGFPGQHARLGVTGSLGEADAPLPDRLSRTRQDCCGVSL